MNATVESYLRAYCNWEQDNWNRLLAPAKFVYNNSKYLATGHTSFFANQEYYPRALVIRETNNNLVNGLAVLSYTKNIWDLFKTLKRSLRKVQASNTRFYNRHRKLLEFKLGDQVWLWMLDIWIHRSCQKLSQKKIGPFTISKTINQNAYKLNLPVHYHI